MSRRRVPSKPRRRTFITGQTLPALTDKHRPIPLGLDEEGEDDGAIRAFAVNVRNTSDSAIYIREGDGSDEAKIDRFEHYTIWESNGINSVSLRGENGDEVAELRVLEAHNDFSIKDKIDAFVRAVSHFFASSKTEAVITGSEVVFDTKITDATGVNFDTSISGVDAGVTFDTSISDVADSVNVNTTLAASDVTLDTNIASSDATLNTNIASQSANVSTTIDDINTLEDLNVNLNAQNIDNVTTDISAQSVGDLNVMDIEGTPSKLFMTVDNGDMSNVYTANIQNPATNDGFIQSIYARFYEPTDVDTLDEMAVAIIVNGNSILPREIRSTRGIDNFARNSRQADIQRYDENNECVFHIEPTIPFKWRKGDTVLFQLRHEDGMYGSSTDSFKAETTILYVEREEV